MPRSWMIFLIALTTTLVGSAALAQRIVVSPQAIVVNPLPTFDVEVFVDRDPSGRETPAYRVGEEIEIGVRVSESAYVYLFSVSASGEIVQILPNRFDSAGRENFIEANTTRYFPPRNARYTFAVDPPNGLAKVIAVASKRELDTRDLAQFSTERDFQATSRLGEDGFARALSIVVQPLPQDAWVTSTALYYVGTRPQQSAYGTLSATSEPRDAEVFVDGQFAGFTPLTFGLRPGRYEIEFRRDGFTSERQTVQIRPGTAAQVSSRLQALSRDGTVTFTSSPAGADVYVDGRFVATTPTGRISLSEGDHTARFEIAGRRTSTVNFTVQRDRHRTVEATLAAIGGRLDLTANVGNARVFVNGNEVGRVPSGTGRLVLDELPDGVHEVVVIAPGYETHVSMFRVRDGQTTTLTVRQQRL
ncbi:PEGA domain-containing protein [soil metagenome]